MSDAPHVEKEDRLAAILKSYNIDRSQVCILNWILRKQFYNWCAENNISLMFLGMMVNEDVWHIEKKEHMMWVNLRWL